MNVQSDKFRCECGAMIDATDRHFDCPVWMGLRTANSPRAEGEVRRPVPREKDGLRYLDTSAMNGAEMRAWGAERALELQQGKGMDVPHRLQKIGVPADFILALRKPKHTIPLAAAERFLKAPQELIRTLLLAGERPGTGKSTAAAFVLWKEAERQRDHLSAKWVRAAALTQATDFGQVDPEWFKGLRVTGLLVLDELGTEATTAGLAAVQDLLRERHERQRRTVLTTNLTLETFRTRYGDAIADRIAAAGITPDLREAPALRKKGTP